MAGPEFDQQDISNTNGPVDTRDNSGTTELHVHDKDANSGGIAQPGTPCFSNKLKHVYELKDLTLTTSYQTVYEETSVSTGKLVGFGMNCDKNDYTVKLTVDSNEIFELSADQLASVQSDGPGSSGLGHRSTGGGPTYNASGYKFTYDPLYPIAYGDSFKIEIKKADIPQAVKLIDQIINYVDQS